MTTKTAFEIVANVLGNQATLIEERFNKANGNPVTMIKCVAQMDVIATVIENLRVRLETIVETEEAQEDGEEWKNGE